MIVSTGNLDWIDPGHRWWGVVQPELAARTATDVWCLTEIPLATAERAAPHTLMSRGADGYGHDGSDGARAGLASRAPFAEVRDVLPGAPVGRFAARTVETQTGSVRIVVVCIPWFDAHVRTGRRDRKRWEEHEMFLEAFDAYIREAGSVPTVIAGDFNQRLQGTFQPRHLRDRLLEVLNGWDILTEERTAPDGETLIDHIAVSPQLQGEVVDMWGPELGGTVVTKQHPGITAEIGRR